MKLVTEVSCLRPERPLGLDEPVCLLGSCFSDEMGRKLSDAGFRVLANPFGTLYNPASIAAAVARLDDPVPFREEDCVPLGAGDGRTGSFFHHTSFARSTAAEFLKAANACLAQATGEWERCGAVILTLGTARVWRALERPGRPVVANCLKRPAREFAHELLSVEECTRLLRGIVETHPQKRFILTVSPIRHLGEGAHVNSVSKATLHLAVEHILTSFADGRSLPDGAAGNYFSDRLAEKPISDPPSAVGESPRVEYFPAYELLLDELRDYRFYAEDLVHPSPTAVELIWERFLATYAAPADLPRIRENEKAARAARHRPIR